MAKHVIGVKVFKRIHSARAVRNVTEADLIGRVGISKSAWSRMKSGGQSLSIYNLILVCRSLDVNSDYLLGLSDDMQRLN